MCVSDKPSSPESLSVSEVHSDHVVLNWESPEFDGGADIKGYLVEKRDASKTTWVTAGEVDSSTRSFKVGKLFEGTDYVFRVSAQNKIGYGEPVELSQAITAKLPYGECDFYLQSLSIFFVNH